MGGVLLVANDTALVFSDTLCRGLNLADISVGGLSVGEAEKIVAQALAKRQAEPVLTLQYGEKKWDVPWDIVRNRPDAASLVRRAYGVGRTGNLLERIESQFVSTNGGKTIPLGLEPDMEKLRLFISDIASNLERKPVDAILTDTHSNLHIEPDVTGLRVDIEATLLKTAQAITTGRAYPVSVVASEKPAAVRVADLKGIDGLLASFATTFDLNDEDRSHNIKIAAEKLNGTLVKGGAILSFNDRIGTRVPEAGYRMAPTMSSTGMVMDWGGGVCQVSTTLYNAALLSDFQVIERSAHYEPPAYVPLGLDATVADGQIDLKLKNNSANPIYIKSSVEAGKLDVRIYGKRDAQIAAVKIETAEKSLRVPQTLIVQDHSLPFGEEIVDSEGKPAFQVMVQRIKLRGNIELSRETISTDEFEGADRIVRVGTLKDSGTSGK